MCRGYLLCILWSSVGGACGFFKCCVVFTMIISCVVTVCNILFGFVGVGGGL